MNVPNALEVKKVFTDAYIATPTKYFSLMLSFNPDTPQANEATIAAVAAYADTIRPSNPELAAKMDILVNDMYNQ